MNHRLVSLFVLSSVTFGTAFVGIKAGVGVVPPLLLAALRYDLGAAVLLATLVARVGLRACLPRRRSDVVAVGVAGVFLVLLNGLLLFVGQQFTTSAAAAVIYGIVPVATVLFAVLLLDERVSTVGAVGLLVGFAGLVLVVRPSTDLLAGVSLGEPLIALSAFSVAFGSVLLRRIEPTMSSLAVTTWAMVVGAAGAHAVSLLFGESIPTTWSTTAIGSVLYLGVVSTAIAFPAYFALIREAGPSRANLVAYAVPVVAAVTGVVVLGESVSTTTVAGFVVVLVGFSLVEHETLRADLRSAWSELRTEN